MQNKNYFRLLIIFIICSLPLPLIFSNIFYGLLICYTIYYAFKHKVKLKIKTLNVVFILLYVVMCLSYFWSINKELTLVGISRKSAFLVIPILFSIIPRFTQNDFQKIFDYMSKAYTAYAVFFIFMGLIQYFTTGNLDTLVRHELVSPLSLNRVYVSLFTVIGIFYLFYYGDKSNLNKMCLLILVVFLLLLSSKTIVITTSIILILLNFRKIFSFSKKLKLIFLFGTIAFSILYVKYNPKFYSELIPKKITEVITKTDFGNNYYFNGSELRILYTRFLYEFQQEESILVKGFGLNASQEKLNEKCLQYNIPEGYGTVYNFHNQYNQTLAETGFLGLLLLIIILYLGFKKVIQNRDKFSLSVFMVFSFLFFTESVFNRQRGIYIFIIIFLLLLHIDRKKQNNFKEELINKS